MTTGSYLDETSKVLAWWFAAGDTMPNGDGRKIVVGEKLTVSPPLVLCKHGFHGSKLCLDALQYAHGPWLHRPRHSGEILYGDDKLCSTERTILARVDFTPQLRLFARQCASDVLHLWNAPEVVRDYLATGDEALQGAARRAAWAARYAGAAAGAAAWAAWASGDAAWAARDAAWAARDAGGAAAGEKQVASLEALALVAVAAAMEVAP